MRKSRVVQLLQECFFSHPSEKYIQKDPPFRDQLIKSYHRSKEKRCHFKVTNYLYIIYMKVMKDMRDIITWIRQCLGDWASWDVWCRPLAPPSPSSPRSSPPGTWITGAFREIWGGSDSKVLIVGYIYLIFIHFFSMG